MVEVSCGFVQDVADVGSARIARVDGIGAAGQGNGSIRTKVNDDLDLSIETVDVSRLMVHRVGGEADAVDAQRAHLPGL